MSIRFRCAHCNKQLKIDEKYAGRKGTCSHCGKKTYIPTLAEAAAEGQAVAEPPPSIVWKSVKALEKEDKENAPLHREMGHIDHEDLIDMTAMVDIVFFLLIFFLTTSFQAINSSLPMPAPQTNDAPQANASESEDVSDSIAVRIDKDDAIYIEDLRIEGEIELAHKMRDLRESAGRPDKVEIVASGEASQGAAILVMDSAKDAGLDKFKMTIDDEAASN